MCVYVYVLICAYICICTYMFMYIYICICTYMFIYICKCTYMFIYICICTYMCKYTDTYICLDLSKIAIFIYSLRMKTTMSFLTTKSSAF